MAFKSFFSRVKSSFKLRRSKNPSNIPENPILLSPDPLFVDCQPATPLPFEKPRRSSFKHCFASFLGCGFRTHEDDLPESPPCKWDETPRRDYNSSISSDDELFRPPPPPTQHAITTSISGDSDEEFFPPPPPPPPTPTRHSIITALADSGLCGYEGDDEEEEEMVTFPLNRKKRTKKLQPSFPAERSKMEGGRSVLERCDKLLAEMRSGTELQPSTVSVLDSSSSPLPVMKRSIGFKDELGEFDEDIWDDCDFVYISEILRASNYLPKDYDIFQFLEEQQYLKGNDTSGVSSLQRKLIFDTVSEILNRDREMPPWKVLSRPNSSIGKPSLQQIWSEFQRIRERDTAENLFDSVCGVPRKELAGGAITGRGDCPVEMSEVTLDIERMIFKDLISETIGDLVAFDRNRKSSAHAHCRKLRRA